ncbi:MAG: EamA family transporter [Verrucomicrobia bacterium]|nr:EamA family transporter [Verrucomicrobiota bacterium]
MRWYSMRPTRLVLVAFFAALYLIWGSTYLGILFAIQTIPPFLMAGSRYLTAGLVLYAIARARGAARPPRETWRPAAITGACLLLAGNGGVTFSEKFLDSGLAAVMVATVPIYIVLLSWGTGIAARPSAPVMLGLAGGFVGVGILMVPSLHFAADQTRQPGIGMIILLCSSFVWSAGSLYSRHAKSAESPFLAAGQQMICGGALLLLTGLVTRERMNWRDVSTLSICSWIYLVLIGAIIGFSAYIYLLRHCDPAKVATYAYVNPIVAVVLGALFAGETLSPRAIAAATLIIGSVAIVITAQQFGRKTPFSPPALAEAD